MEPSAALDRGEAIAREIGQRLREVRIARGESLEAIAKRLLVKPADLEALEGGELDRLPSRHHAAGYARAYAKQLGLEGDELSCPLLTLSGWPAPEPSERQPRRRWQPSELLRRHPRQAAAALVAVVALGTAVWSVGHVRHGHRATATVAIASATAAPLPAPKPPAAETGAPDGTATAVEPPAAAPAQESPADGGHAVADQSAEPAVGGGQVAVASTPQADTPLPAETGSAPATELPVIAVAQPDPAPEAAEASPAEAEELAPAAAPPRTSGRFSVQVASVRDRAAIPALWARLTGRQHNLAGLEPQEPQAVNLPGRGTFYRLLAGSFARKADAQAACDRLRAGGTSCVVVGS